jgi:hypothetical protein
MSTLSAINTSGANSPSPSTRRFTCKSDPPRARRRRHHLRATDLLDAAS